MKEKAGKFATIFIIGGLSYGIMEILNRGFSHITMGILGGLSLIVIHLLNDEYRKDKISLPVVLLLSAAFITSIEFLSGEILNGVLKMNIWTYEEMPLNFDGQICLPFTAIWFVLSFVGVLADNFIRSSIFKEVSPPKNRPHINKVTA